MLDGVEGTTSIVIPLAIGALIILVVGFIYFKKKNGNPSQNNNKTQPIKKVVTRGNLEGDLVYGYGKTLLRRSFELDGSDEMDISIGPEASSDHHMMVRKGANFNFTVSAVDSRGGDKIIHIRCQPPGVLKYNGKVLSETHLYSGEEIMMNDIPVRYENGHKASEGQNKLKGRI